MQAAVSGLKAAQAGLGAASNNISNVNTPGYARTRVDQTTGATAGRISGVVVGETVRVADRFLELTVHRRAGAAGGSEVRAEYLDQVQSLLGEPGAESGLPNRLDQVSATAIAMSAPGAANETSALFVSAVQDAVTTIQQLGRDVTVIRDDVETEVGDTVSRINSLLKQVGDFNDQVVRLEQSGGSPSSPEGLRNSALEELGRLIEIVPRVQPSGRINIDTVTGVPLVDSYPRHISYASSNSGSLAQFPAMTIRYLDATGNPGAATGETITSTSIGGKLGGLLDLRDRVLPGFSEEVGSLMQAFAQSLNSASNAASATPAPNSLVGRTNGLIASDQLNFTGQAQFAVTDANGILVATTTVDFDALGAGATINDAITAINAGLGGAATASFTNNRLSLTATSAKQGVVVADVSGDASSRAGIGFSQFFGLNDVVRSSADPLTPSGFRITDPHGFTTGSATNLVLRDAGGRVLATHDINMTAGGTMGDILTNLQASPLAAHGNFSLDNLGRFRFDPTSASSGAVVAISGDTTDRFGTGLGFGALSGLTSQSMPLDSVSVRQELVSSPTRLPIALLQQNVVVGSAALGGADRRGADIFNSQLNARMDLGRNGTVSLPEFTAKIVTRVSREANQAQVINVNAASRFDDAVNRRNSFSGVNIDEELASMVQLQNSYAAAARVLTTSREMYDTLMDMLG